MASDANNYTTDNLTYRSSQEDQRLHTLIQHSADEYTGQYVISFIEGQRIG